MDFEKHGIHRRCYQLFTNLSHVPKRVHSLPDDDDNQPLYQTVRAVPAKPEAANLLEAVDIGRAAMEAFITDRLIEENRNRLKTFATSEVSKTMRSSMSVPDTFEEVAKVVFGHLPKLQENKTKQDEDEDDDIIEINNLLDKSKELEQVIQDDNDCSYDEIPESEDDTDETEVHKAMGILRRRIIENNPKLDDFFYAPEEMKLSDQ
ncbi:hypothetical protein DPMN_078911 [Dreissena polymorpha]|uniref:Uncharacterized protein n=1 Tax=Dreissena polymorpha TaxID=45954 RepID=A0A9D4BSJ3_DREPO|nr:hypothetical protein DPMN_078911 [Dreissena polymorpha]